MGIRPRPVLKASWGLRTYVFLPPPGISLGFLRNTGLLLPPVAPAATTDDQLEIPQLRLEAKRFGGSQSLIPRAFGVPKAAGQTGTNPLRIGQMLGLLQFLKMRICWH